MKRTMIGGQAVMEGVMMKNLDRYAVAVRKPDKEIVVDVQDYISYTDRYPILKLPILRGVASFVESLVVGMKTLTYSASFFEDEEEQQKQSKVESFLDRCLKGKAEDVLIGITVCFSVIMAIGLFMILPYFLANLIKPWINSNFMISFLEGVVRIGLFLLYITLISKMKDIKRTFMYHGAEHKTINCLEHGEDLTVENVRKHSRYHKRCGTSFLLIVMVVSVIFFMFIQVEGTIPKLLLRLVLVPVIAGVSYEFIRLAGRSNNRFVNWLSKPGMALQGLTTKEPEDEMIEVAIRSVEAVFDWKPYVEALRRGEVEGCPCMQKDEEPMIQTPHVRG